MLLDPEKPYREWEDLVWASSLAKARFHCEAMATETELTEVINVTQETQRPSKAGNYKFLCWFRTEVGNDGDSND